MRGEKLFYSICAACHALDQDITGPRLRGVVNRPPYNGDVNKVLRWVKNTYTLVNTDPYYKSLKAKFGGVVMPVFNSDEDLKAIIEYLGGPQLNQGESIAYMRVH